MITVLVVCWGNIFRSPVAENLINKKLVELGLTEEIGCISRGIQGQGGIPAPKFQQFHQYSDEYALAKPILDHYRINIENHRATPIDQRLLNTYDLIIPMDEKVTTQLISAHPEIREKILIFSDPESGTTIEDPATSLNPNKYEKIIPEIISLVELLTPRLVRLAEDLEPVNETKNETRKHHIEK